MLPSLQLAGFMAKYSPSMAAQGRAVLTRMRRLVPGAVLLVYDNYNGLVVGFGPNARASEAVMSFVVFPRWVTLCFLQDGPLLPDPAGLLRGNGKRVRHMRLVSARDLDTPPVRALITEALARADVPINPRQRGKLVIKSISKKQRPRRPL